jgi:hypothetical protein
MRYASTARLEVLGSERGIQDAHCTESGQQQRRESHEPVAIFSRVEIVGRRLGSVAVPPEALPTDRPASAIAVYHTIAARTPPSDPPNPTNFAHHTAAVMYDSSR